MRSRRIYIDQPLRAGETLALPIETAHYLRKVLRLSDNAEVTLFDGSGFDYQAKLEYVGKKQLFASVSNAAATNNESLLDIHLGIGISRGERMDWVMQKCTELGVQKITPMFTERCEVKIDAQRLEKRLTHWRGITISACEQSGRSYLPQVLPAINLAEWIEQSTALHRFILHPEQSNDALPRSLNSSEIALLVGPEGGFEDSEVNAALEQGFISIQLGPRILRTETAPIAAISAMQALWGDFL